MEARKQVAALALGALVLGLAMTPLVQADEGDAAAVLSVAPRQTPTPIPDGPADDVVIREGNGVGPVLYEIRDGRAYAGNAATGDVLYTERMGSIILGAHPSGAVAFTVRGDCLREGRRGTCVLHFRNDKVIEWRTGKTIYELHEDRLYDGRGEAMLTADVDLEEANDATKWLVIVLLEAQVR